MRYKYKSESRKYKKLKPRVGRIAILVSLVIVVLAISVIGVKSLVGILNPPEPKPMALFKHETTLLNEQTKTAKDIINRDFPIGKDKTGHSALSDNVKIACLTFDDGPGYDSTDYLLKVLKKYDVKATFFVLGSRVEQNPKMLKRLVKAGHEIASHSWDHPDLTTLTPEQVKQQLDMTDAAIIKAGGKKTRLLRPPYGKYSAQIEESTNKGIFLWNIDSNDWRHKDDPNASANVVLSSILPHAAILYHDIYESSVKSAEIIIPKLKEMGYTFVTASDFADMTGAY